MVHSKPTSNSQATVGTLTLKAWKSCLINFLLSSMDNTWQKVVFTPVKGLLTREQASLLSALREAILPRGVMKYNLVGRRICIHLMLILQCFTDVCINLVYKYTAYFPPYHHLEVSFTEL